MLCGVQRTEFKNLCINMFKTGVGNHKLREKIRSRAFCPSWRGSCWEKTGVGRWKRVMPEPTFLHRPLYAHFPFLSCVLLVLNVCPLQGQQLHACKESEYHYEYTECDSKGTRWRVAVPHVPGLCTGLPDPIKGTECSFSCTAGQYLDMALQKCTPCGEGTYSLGTGVRFDEWAELPHGFTSISSNQYGADYGVNENCSMSQWEARGEYVASNTDECSAILMYSINLKQEGRLSFDYLHPDSNIVFEFYVHNDQCQPREEESRWMRTTENGWNFHQVQLTKGTNVLSWRTAAFSMGHIAPKPVLLRNILITGAAYTSECFPCKPGTFAPTSGASACKLCPHNTFSNRGASSCIPCESDKYSGWEVARDYIYTSAGSSDNDYMVLTLNIHAFSPPRRVTEDFESNEVSQITFVFDMKCSTACQLFFMKGVNSEMTSLIESWQGSREKQSYSYRLESNSNTTFTWAFQRTSNHTNEGRKYTGDVAKIYSINVTNAKDGVASWCQPCATDTDSQCVSCPPGHYIDKHTSRCISCPVNTYLQSHLPFGVETCTPCGPGTKSNDAHSLCFSDCQLTVSTGGGKLQYDFSSLSNVTTCVTPSKFTNKGLKYFHQFSISLCGNQGRKLATCVQNMSDARMSDTEAWHSVASYVCQSIIVPSDSFVYKTLMSAQPISIADQLIGVTTESTLDKISSPDNLFPGENAAIKDIIFYYRSKDVTQSCASGRATTIRLRCNPLKAGRGTVSVPRECSDGTCDGCTFHFLWESEQACPVCTVHDYHIITSVCQHGIQTTTALWHIPRLCVGGVDLPAPAFTICKSADFWLKVGVTLGISSALVLTALTSYYWKKNRSLEYKYSRLMMNAPSKDGELPAADSCAIMEGEDAEDELIFNNRRSILRKFMSLSGKRTSDGFDSVPLKSSVGEHTDM
ncbi:endosome/lysosome-associated apoptosis and autophagy regulator 1-like isoform X3 [Pseudophryne corroboree]|uniref:endosome/lysosome-associated apoptosis and autophagy regulator 1-like isoform X3 n=1 Tax=Pseudophryne corroboree TaxID=495146 RepID=UPI003081FEF5